MKFVSLNLEFSSSSYNLTKLAQFSKQNKSSKKGKQLGPISPRSAQLRAACACSPNTQQQARVAQQRSQALPDARGLRSARPHPSTAQSRGRSLTGQSSPAARPTAPRPAPMCFPRAPVSTHTGCTICGET
jgi:hypothetical protein